MPYDGQRSRAEVLARSRSGLLFRPAVFGLSDAESAIVAITNKFHLSVGSVHCSCRTDSCELVLSMEIIDLLLDLEDFQILAL
jgi:hypothetical protein